MKLSNAAAMRQADRIAIAERGIPSDELMMTAAGHVASAALEQMGENLRAVIFCGSGNNGGDGVATAVHLIPEGVSCRVLLVGSRARMTEDTREMERRLQALGGILEDFDPDDASLSQQLAEAGVVIDAMFGIGLNSDLRGNALAAVRFINACMTPVVAADIASGVEADTGRILGDAVHATVTVTFSLAKPGHVLEPGCIYCGELQVQDIGIPADLIAAAAETGIEAVTEADVSLPQRARLSHKGDYGKLLIVGGSVGYTGAPVLCSNAACRSGAGLVWLGVPESIYAIAAGKVNEAMPFPLPAKDGSLCGAAKAEILTHLDRCDVLVLGPGLGRTEETLDLVRELVAETEKPVVVDADGLTALANHLEILQAAKAPVILTPHEGEFVRVGGVMTGDRAADACAFAVQNRCILVLKGHRTVCAFPDGNVFVNTTGNPGMATGGSGDVLAGILGGLLGQLPTKRAVVTAVWLHGRAGDLAAECYGEYAMLPSDCIALLADAEYQILEAEAK
ncbi:MAG: NAD(P)H-hydrate dehydratase [Oscillospiraceae bacterium]